MEGDVALPRQNGELVFEAPWEGRIFGLAVALNEAGIYPWRNFRDQLVAKIAAAEAKGESSTYYERWLASLESLLIEGGWINPDDLDHRTDQYASGEIDDDHDHDDDHPDH